MFETNRAIVLSSPRSGSELLVNCLNKHPNIRCESELVGNYQRKYKIAAGLPFMEMYFDEQRLLRDGRTYIFKAMYDDLDDDCWKWIKDNQVKIIHLIREDHLRRIISWDFMRRPEDTGRKSSKAFEKIPFIELDVDVNWVIHNLKRTLKQISKYREEIKDLPHVEITYRDIVGSEGEEIKDLPIELNKKLIHFLGLDYPPLWTQLKKQNHKETKKMVNNYEELKAELIKHELEKYL